MAKNNSAYHSTEKKSGAAAAQCDCQIMLEKLELDIKTERETAESLKNKYAIAVQKLTMQQSMLTTERDMLSKRQANMLQKKQEMKESKELPTTGKYRCKPCNMGFLTKK